MTGAITKCESSAIVCLLVGEETLAIIIAGVILTFNCMNITVAVSTVSAYILYIDICRIGSEIALRECNRGRIVKGCDGSCLCS